MAERFRRTVHYGRARGELREEAAKMCHEYTKKFYECARAHQFTVWLKCRSQRDAMVQCMKQYQRDELIEERARKNMAAQMEKTEEAHRDDDQRV